MTVLIDSIIIAMAYANAVKRHTTDLSQREKRHKVLEKLLKTIIA
jgi:hypothetical protein